MRVTQLGPDQASVWYEMGVRMCYIKETGTDMCQAKSAEL